MWSILDRRRDAEALLGCDQVVVAVEPGVELRPFHGAVEAGVRARLVLADLACAHSRTTDTATNGRGDWRARPFREQGRARTVASGGVLRAETCGAPFCDMQTSDASLVGCSS